MVQQPKSRRSKPTRKPVTIDLEASEVQAQEARGADVHAAEPVAFEQAGDSGAAPETVMDQREEAIRETVKTGGMDEEAREAIEAGESHSDEPAEKETPRENSGKTTPPPAARRGGGLTWLGGGVLGGLVALLIAGGAQWAGVLPSLRQPEPVDLSPLQARIDALSSQVDNMQGATPAVPDDLASKLDAAEASATANREAIAAARGDLSTLQDKVSALDDTVSSGGAGENAGLEALTERAGAIETSLASLSSRVEALETSGPATGDGGATPEAVTAVQETVASLRSEIDTLGQSVDETRSRIEAIAGRLDKVEGDIEAGAGSRVAAAIAASALKSAADRGGGFMSELEAYASVASDQDTVAALRDYAASGVPTVTQLSERFPAVANRIVAAASGVGSDAGIVDRLAASARSLVQVRPVGDVEGDKPGEIAARMEVALKDGDLGRVVSQWETLPEAAQQASSAFIADVKARNELDTLIARVLSGAMASAETGTGE
ncbi:MAG: hypothetical protein CL535_15185 [Ahrensia sp.]|nr:hypothetical protein [Ahrensia sp.]|tara:strand:+ start:44350 stop:45831 length:1482 start_codon:yes stop_codon:yes gene_type:complete